MKISKLLNVSEPPARIKNRSIIYLTVALIAQILFWYLAIPGPQLEADHERSFNEAATSCFISAGCLLVIPLVCILVMRDDIKRFGFGFGDFKYGICAVLVVGPVFAVATAIGSGDEALAGFYPMPGAEIGKDFNTYLLWLLCYACFYVSFEFFFRGFLLYGADDLGLAVGFILQLGCCVLIHAGKPFPETLVSIPASIVFAWITIRSRSFIYAFVIHWMVGATNDTAILWQQNGIQWAGN